MQSENGVVHALQRSLREKLHSHYELAGIGLQLRADALWVKGAERKSGQQVSAVYFGGGFPSQIFEILFSSYTVERHEKCAMWTAMRRLQEDHPGVDLLLGALPWTFYPRVRDSRLLHIPSLIVQMLPLPTRFADLMEGFRKRSKVRDVRKMEKLGLTYRVVHSVEAVDDFYDNMYVPFARERFGQFALIDSRKNIRNAAALGGLLQVLLADRVLGAGVVSRVDDCAFFTWLGLPEGVDPEIADVVRGALYYFTMKHAHELGCSDLHVGYTAPLVEGGIYQYKRKWGAGVVDDWLLDEILLRPLNFTAGVRACLANQPVIVRQAGELHGKVLLDGPVAREKLEYIAERYSAPGMSSLKVFTTEPIAAELTQSQHGSFVPLQLIDLSRSADAAADFGRL
jgi:hypothetical protein